MRQFSRNFWVYLLSGFFWSLGLMTFFLVYNLHLLDSGFNEAGNWKDCIGLYLGQLGGDTANRTAAQSLWREQSHSVVCIGDGHSSSREIVDPSRRVDDCGGISERCFHRGMDGFGSAVPHAKHRTRDAHLGVQPQLWLFHRDGRAGWTDRGSSIPRFVRLGWSSRAHECVSQPVRAVGQLHVQFYSGFSDCCF